MSEIVPDTPRLRHCECVNQTPWSEEGVRSYAPRRPPPPPGSEVSTPLIIAVCVCSLRGRGGMEGGSRLTEHVRAGMRAHVCVSGGVRGGGC